MKWNEVTGKQAALTVRVAPPRKPCTREDDLHIELKRLLIERQALEKRQAETLEARAKARAARIVLLEYEYTHATRN